MMMRSNQLHKKYLIAFGVFIVLFLGVLLFRGSSFSFVSTISSYVWNVANVQKIQDLSKYFERRSVLIERNKELENEIAEQRVFALDRDRLRTENEQFRTILGRKGNVHVVAASILSKPPISPYDTFVVDAGTNDGVKNDAEVLMFGDVVIGEVFAVSSNTSKVRLYSSPGNNIRVFLGEKEVPAALTGSGAGNFKTEIPQGISIPVGTSVYLPGSDDELLGVVGQVENRENDTFQELYIESPVDVWSIRFVEIKI